MKIKLITLLIFCSIFSILSLEAQDKFPKKLIIDNVELIAITPTQLTKINTKFVELDLYKEETDSMKIILNNYKSLNDLLFKQVSTKDTIINKYQNIIKVKDLVINDKSFELSELRNKEKKNKIMSGISIGLGVTLSVAGLLTLLLK